MILIDNALLKRDAEKRPIRVALAGAGFIGKGIALQMATCFKGLDLVAISDRDIGEAEEAFVHAGEPGVTRAKTPGQLSSAVAGGRPAVTEDPLLLCGAEEIDAVIDVTGDPECGARLGLSAMEQGKHFVTNAELTATVGPMMKVYADRAGVVMTDTEGDQPGVLMNLVRFVRAIGYEPRVAGNIKGYLNPYENPDTQQDYASRFQQNPRMTTSFADGTKISLEMAALANATGFGVKRRGMEGPVCGDVREAITLFSGDGTPRVDYILGGQSGPGVFVLGYNDHPTKRRYMTYFKMGDGPYYLFCRPFHLTHLEAPLSAARAVLYGDAVLAPAGGPICEVIAFAKKDLAEGTELDGIGGFTCYGRIENAAPFRQGGFLPVGLSRGCRLLRPVARDQAITLSDVAFPEGRLIDRLWVEQNAHSWPK